LTGLLGKKVLAAKKRLRVQVLLKADAGPQGPTWIDSRIAEAFDVTVLTVEKIRKSYVLEGLEAAIERKKQCRPSRQPVLDGPKEARLVALCCGTVPAGHGRWTLSLLADKLVELKIVESISRETVRQALKKTSCSLGGG
jgi:transposase